MKVSYLLFFLMMSFAYQSQASEMCNEIKTNGYDLAIGRWGHGYPFKGNHNKEDKVSVTGRIESITSKEGAPCSYVSVKIISKTPVLIDKKETGYYGVQVDLPADSKLLNFAKIGSGVVFERTQNSLKFSYMERTDGQTSNKLD